MERTTKVLLIGGAIFAGYWLYSKYRAYQLLNIRLSSFRFGGSILQPIVYISLSMDNPTDQSAQLNSIAGTVYTDTGESIGTVMFNSSKTVQPFGTTTIELPINVYLTQQLNSQTKFVQFRGTANVNGIGIPFTLQQNLR